MTLPNEVLHLRAENAAQREQIAALQSQLDAALAQLNAALARIADLEQRPPDPPPFLKPATPKRPSKPRRKRDPKHNQGRRYDAPTRIETHDVTHCPDCRQRLRSALLARKRQVIDLLPPPPVEVVEHHVIKRWCSWCRRWKAPRLDLQGQVLGHSRLGVRVASLVAYLRTTARLPIRRIRAYLETIHRLTLSDGEIAELLHRVRRSTQGAVSALKRQARASPILYADETGWRERGQNGYVWSLTTEGPHAVRDYEYHKSRAGAVAQRLIGKRYRGVLTTDFYAGYNKLPGRHQRCWVHLLRDLKKLTDKHGQDVWVRQWAVQVEATYRLAQQRLGQEPSLARAQRKALYARLVERIGELGRQYADTPHACQTLAKRVLQHQGELFQFVLVEGLRADNTISERSLRGVVVMRKVSGGTRSAEGSKTRLSLTSLFETWHARGQNPFEQCLALLTQTPIPQV
jgi:transposase